MSKLTTSYGVWNAEIYDNSIPFTRDTVEWDGEWVPPLPGVNIKLTFTPNDPSNSRIRLVQFKQPASSSYWELDRSRKYAVPWYGFGDDENPLILTDVGNMGRLESYVGYPMVGEGRSGSPAVLIDTVRDTVGVPKPGKPKVGTYTTFAYDLSTSSWLGGVSWGFTTSQTATGALPTIQTNRLVGRQHVSPHAQTGEEADAIARWNNDRTRTPVP